VLCALLASAVAAVAAAPSQTIVIDPETPDGKPLELWSQSTPVPERIPIELGLGDELGGRLLRVGPAQGPDVRAYVQFETSAAIGGEGPHIDLLDWKHCRSGWQPAQAEAGGFRLPMPSDGDRSCFPNATRAELQAAVAQALDRSGVDAASRQQWLASAGRVTRVGELPSYVAISKMRVRIEQYDGREWKLLTTIEFSVPMGC
jgi:hypothetical protein